MPEPLTLQHILRQHLDRYRREHPLDARRLAVCHHLIDCHTEALGGLRLDCDHCHDRPVVYYGCRDRHCPGCQHHAALHWQEKQQQHLLPVTYFHLVFTLPDTLNGWVILHPGVIYRLLFRCAWETLQAFARSRLSGEPGMTALLHTWGQNLSLHPHLHCLVPGGALDGNDQWHPARGHYLFPVRALSRRFRGRMVSALRQAFEAGELSRVTDPDEPKRTLNRLMQQDWVVYCRPGMTRPEQVIRYLARYTHRTAIGNNRLLGMDENGITFRYKDYADHDRNKTLTLAIDEFIRRFTQHILPKGLMRIRHYGFLANACRRRKLPRIRAALAAQGKVPASAPADPEKAVQKTPAPFSGWPCPKCHKGHLRVIGECPPHRWEGGG